MDTMPAFINGVGKAIDGEHTRKANEEAVKIKNQLKLLSQDPPPPGINSGSAQQPRAPPPTIPPQPPPSKQQQACKKCGSLEHRIMDCPELTPCVECQSRMCPKGSYTHFLST